VEKDEESASQSGPLDAENYIERCRSAQARSLVTINNTMAVVKPEMTRLAQELPVYKGMMEVA
jgi:hypothetical protein